MKIFSIMQKNLKRSSAKTFNNMKILIVSTVLTLAIFMTVAYVVETLIKKLKEYEN